MNKSWQYYAYDIEGAIDAEISIDGQKYFLDKIEKKLLNSFISRITISDALITASEVWAASGNSSNGRQMRDVKKCDFTNFGPLDLPETIDWTMGQPGQNNLSWRLHIFIFIRDLTSAYLAEADDWYVTRIKHVVGQWAKENINNPPPSIFSWNDHTTALRLTVIGHLLCFFKSRNLLDVDFFRLCLLLAYRHQQVLLDENFYVRGTNHGLDQAFSLYQSTLVFEILGDNLQTKRVALKRLAFEVAKSFSDDYVHIENSPEYHELILSSVLQINRTVESFEGTGVIENSNVLISEALDYLAYIIRPDGCFPPIGDTLMKPSSSKFEWLKGSAAYEHLVYSRTKGHQGVDAAPWHKVFPQSGYAIFRGDPTLFSVTDRAHIVFKCGFLSHYHRQDDDNNILVFAFGEEWLTDGGLYKHDQQDPHREHLRSHFAHNVMAPVDKKAERRHCLSPASMIQSYSSDDKSPWVRGVSTMFPGYTYQRTLAFDGAYKFSVEDSIAPTTATPRALTYEQYWQIPADKSVVITPTTVIIGSQQTERTLAIEFVSANLISLEEIHPEDGSCFGWRSVEYGKLERVRTIRLVFCCVGPAEVSASFIFSREDNLIKKRKDQKIKKNNILLTDSNALFRDLLNKDVLLPYGGFRYPCRLKLNPKARYLSVQLHGTVPRGEGTSLPYFTRWDWGEKLGAHVLSICDPTLYQNETLSFGWYLGNNLENVIPGIVDIAQRCAELVGVPQERIVYSGLSGGGFAALQAAALTKNSCAIAINAQTNLSRHNINYVSNYIDSVSGCTSVQEAERVFAQRLDAIRSLKESIAQGGTPRVLFVQNRNDWHFQAHFVPCAEAFGLSLHEDQSVSGNFMSILYDGPSAHTPEPEEVVERINNEGIPFLLS